MSNRSLESAKASRSGASSGRAGASAVKAPRASAAKAPRAAVGKAVRKSVGRTPVKAVRKVDASGPGDPKGGRIARPVPDGVLVRPIVVIAGPSGTVARQPVRILIRDGVAYLVADLIRLGFDVDGPVRIAGFVSPATHGFRVPSAGGSVPGAGGTHHVPADLTGRWDDLRKRLPSVRRSASVSRSGAA